jgi:hypothetical protein
MKTDGKQFCDRCYEKHNILKIARIKIVREESQRDKHSPINDVWVWVLCEKCAHNFENFDRFIYWTYDITHYDKKGNWVPNPVRGGTTVSEPKLTDSYVKTTITRI